MNRFSLSSHDSPDLSSPGSVVRGSSAGKSDLLLQSLAQCCGAVRVCAHPALCRSASLVVSPQAHEGVTSRFIGLLGLSWGLLSFQWTRGISIPHRRDLAGDEARSHLKQVLDLYLLLTLSWDYFLPYTVLLCTGWRCRRSIIWSLSETDEAAAQSFRDIWIIFVKDVVI